MKEIKRLKKTARKIRGEDDSGAKKPFWRIFSKISVKLNLDNRPWLVSLLVLFAILITGLLVSTLFAAPPTALPTLLGYAEGTSCFLDSDCQSSFCTLDVDGSRYCAPPESCVRMDGDKLNTYSSVGPFESNIVDTDAVGYR